MAVDIKQILEKAKTGWTVPPLKSETPKGDMPGDKISISTSHIKKSSIVFPHLVNLLHQTMQQNNTTLAVAAVCGGSGVGKSEIACLLAYYLQELGVGCYVLSGDNYPHRIPSQNDAERLRLFRNGGLSGLLTNNLYTAKRAKVLVELQKKDIDADFSQVSVNPWLEVYQKAGKDALAAYLGGTDEQNFDQITQIISQFKCGRRYIWLKRMGRSAADLWYEKVDFKNVQVLIIEWTHGNSEKYQGVDISLLLNSTPEETREHRRQRNRDGNTDSAFTATVLELEQKMLEAQANRAKLIISKNGTITPYACYRKQMAEETERT